MTLTIALHTLILGGNKNKKNANRQSGILGTKTSSYTFVGLRTRSSQHHIQLASRGHSESSSRLFAFQMTARSEALQVFLRVRPPIFKEVRQENAVIVRGSQAVTLIDDKKETTCSYDHVFSEVSEQQQVFEKVKPLLEDVLSGVNACIFAYGQTSAGKSYTMIGPNGGQDIFRRDADEWGILPRASEFLLGYLNEKAMEGLLSYEVKASFLQIYNENLYDLLRDTGPMIEDKLALNDKDKESDLRIREVPRRKNRDGSVSSNEVFVAGLSEFRVQTSEDILRILAVGANNRMTRSTDFNATSSRSHALLQLTFEIESQSETGQTVINRSKLNLVDLAGSEKIPFVGSDLNNAKHMKELTSINKSLSSLGNVIAALSSNNRTHIPYRDSKLTRILQDSLSGNTRTILLACVAPTVLHASETLSTLQFADRAKNVMLSVKPNTLVDDKFLLTKAHGEITRLKTLLAHALKQLEQRGKDGSPDPAEMMRLQEENDTLRRDNAALKKTLKTAAPGQSISPVSFEQQFQMQQQGSQQQGSQLPYLNYSASNPTLSNNNNNQMMSSMQNVSSNNSVYSAANMSVDSIVSNGSNSKLGKNWDVNRLAMELEQGKKTKKGGKKSNNVPPLLDLLESAHGKKGHKQGAPQASKVHSKIYKSINDRQIEELNTMLSSNAQSNFQQQQNMMQYLQQQQFLQQNFPHQQMSIPTQYQPQMQQPVPGQGLGQGIGQGMGQGMGQVPMAAPGMPQSAMMASINTMAASIMQPQSYNVNNPQRPAPIHLGAPFGATGSYHTGDTSAHQHQQNQHLPHIQAQHPSQHSGQHQGQHQGQHPGQHSGQHQNGMQAQNPYMNPNQQYPPQQQFVQPQAQYPPQYQQPYNSAPVSFPAIPSAQPAPQVQQNYGQLPQRQQEPTVQDISPSTKDSSVAESPKHSILKQNQISRSGSDDGQPPSSNRHTQSSHSNIGQSSHGHPSIGHAHGGHRNHGVEYAEPSILLTGRSSFEGAHSSMDSGRLGTGQTTPGGHSGSAVKMPPNRIVRKGTNKLAPVEAEAPEADEGHHNGQHRHQRSASNDSNDGMSTPSSVKYKPGSSSGLSARMGEPPGSSSQHAFMQNILNNQAQYGPGSVVQPINMEGPSIQRAVNLSHTADDVGRSVQLFSFRMNTWDRIDLIDYDSVKRLHKCRHPDGSVQWLDLAKKPVRAIPEM